FPSATRSPSRIWRPATPQPSMARTSAGSSPTSRAAAMFTFTISRPSAGSPMSNHSNQTFLGYRRDNGRVGVRNHVVILPVDDISNAACEAVANNIKGTLALPHAYGRLQFGADLDLHFRTNICSGSNHNEAAVIVLIGILVLY